MRMESDMTVCGFGLNCSYTTALLTICQVENVFLCALPMGRIEKVNLSCVGLFRGLTTGGLSGKIGAQRKI